MPAEETEHQRGTAPGAGALTRRAVAAVLNPSPAAMRGIALAGVICTAGIIATEQERERNRAVSRHDEVLDHAGGEDVVPAARVLELRQGALDPPLESV